jgi:hypothetical protein
MSDEEGGALSSFFIFSQRKHGVKHSSKTNTRIIAEIRLQQLANMSDSHVE